MGVLSCVSGSFGFMLPCQKKEKDRNTSEACRPILGKYADEVWAIVLIDLLAVFALIAGTATTSSLATPLMSECY